MLGNNLQYHDLDIGFHHQIYLLDMQYTQLAQMFLFVYLHLHVKNNIQLGKACNSLHLMYQTMRLKEKCLPMYLSGIRIEPYTLYQSIHLHIPIL